MRRLPLLSSVALAGLLLAGCPSYQLMQGPRTLAPGQVSFTAAAGAAVSPSALGGVPYAVATTEGAMRIGLVPNLDLGLRLSLNDLGVRGDVKLRLVNTPGFQLAVAPAAGMNLWPLLGEGAAQLFAGKSLEELGVSAHLYSFYLPVVAGIPLGGESLVYFGPQLAVTNWSVSAMIDGNTNGVGAYSWQPGLVVGLDLAFGPSHTYPEIDVHYDPDGGAVFLQVGVATSLELGGGG